MSASGRARIDPRERFAGHEKTFNLEKEFEALPNESRVHNGHMQKALYRHGPVITAIFSLEKDGFLNEHKADGESILHVIDGQLFVKTAENEYTLNTNEMLLLDPGVVHDMKAVKPTRLLFTFMRLDGKDD